MQMERDTERFETVVVGGGQAGLSVGYHLAERGRDFVILDANERVGDSWRHRWDSLLLFTPARINGLAGMRFPARGDEFVGKDAMADYLESYAARFELPVRTRRQGRSSCRGTGTGFSIEAGDRRFEADNVVVAMANYQVPRVPPFASLLDPADRAVPRSRVPQPLAAPAGPRAGRRSGQLRRGHRDRGREDPRDGHGGQGVRPRSVPDRALVRTQRADPARAVRRAPGAHGPHPDRPQDPPEVHGGRGAPRARQAEGSRARGHRARAAGRRRPRRQAVPRRRSSARRRQRDLVHGVRTRASAGSTCRCSTSATNRLHERGIVPSEPGLYFVGLELPVLGDVRHRHGRRPRRAAGRQAHRLPLGVGRRRTHAVAVRSE